MVRKASDAETQLARSIQKQLVNCIGFDGDELAESRKQAFDYYFQRPRGDEIAGRSQIVSGDVSSMVEANLAQMTEPLLGKRIAEFCAYDAQDEEQAQLETDCVADMLFKRENGFIETVSSIKDSLLLRNAVVKVYVDERTHRQSVSMKTDKPEIIVAETLDKIGKTDIHSYDSQSQKLEATVTKTTRRFRVSSVAPENFLTPKGWHRQDLEGIPFCAERHIDPRSTLIEMGLPKDKVDKLRRYNNPHQEATAARLPMQMSAHVFPMDRAGELVEWYECYAYLDDGHGASQLRKIYYSNKMILKDEPTDVIPYGTGTAIINPHSFIGISLFDKLKPVQDGNTALNRALFDNLNATSKSRTAHLDGVVEEDDLTDGRINNSIRVNGRLVTDVRQAIMGFQIPDTSANILQNIQHMKQTRSEMAGASLDLATGQMQLNDRVGSMGLDRAYSVMEALAAFMTRMLANTLIRSMFLIAHETIRTQWKQPIKFKRGKEWLETDPSKWPVRTALVINLGASLGERMRIAAVLEKVLDKQIALAQMGMEEVLVDANGFYTAVMEWLRVNDVTTPEKFFIDPKTTPAQDALKRKALQNQETQKKQDALLNSAVALEQLRTGIEKYKTDAELQFKYFAEVLKAQCEEARLATSAIVNLKSQLATAAKEAQKNVATSNRGNEETGEGSAKQSAVTSDSE